MREARLRANVENIPVLSEMGEEIVKSLAYSEVFKYPLTKSEIVYSMGMEVNNFFEFQEEVANLVEGGIICENKNYYGLSNRIDMLKRRKELNKRAEKYIKKARRISRIIGNFPYVRGVFLSGSITKKSMEKDGDIDYFVITSPGRLWIARTLLIAFKKIFLLNSYKYFCLNYFIDANNLEIQDRNLYVAHEINTLIPTYGCEYCEAFLSANRWIGNYLPNNKLRIENEIGKSNAFGLKWLLEKILSGRIGNNLENFFRKITENHWKSKFRINMNNNGNAFRTSKNMSALHPENFKIKILDRYNEILKYQEDRLNHSFK